MALDKMTSGVFGDRLAALTSLLVGKYRLSKRLVKDALSDMLRVELSVGSVGRAARAWLWVVASALVVVFQIATSRGGKVARHLLGADFAGFLTTDRWSAYEWVDAGPRQL